MPNFTLQGPDAFLFEIDPTTGEVTTKDWFIADFNDAWDVNEDNTYEFTVLDTEDPDPVSGTTDFEYRVTPNDAVFVEAGAAPVLTEFSISGPDTVMFDINIYTGEITLQDWFAPDAGDNWDADENGVYEFTVTASAPDGTTTETPASLTITAEGEYIYDVPDPIVIPDPLPFGTVFSVSGDDAVVFAIDEVTGAVTLNDWFTPDPGDNWDADENGEYLFNIVATAPDGTVTVIPGTLTANPDGTFELNAPSLVVLPDPSGPVDPVDPVDPVTPVDPPLVGTQLLINGNLEAGVAFEANDSAADLDGWSTTSGTADVWGDGFFGVNTPDGGNFVQLDGAAEGALDTLSQSVRTIEDDQMELRFNGAQRFGESESIEVYFDGVLIDTVTPTSSEFWNTYSYTVTGTGGIDTLEFREVASESDGSGPFVDNVSLVSASPDAPALELLPDLTADMLESPDLPTRPMPEPEPEGIPGLLVLGDGTNETLTGTADDDTLNAGAGDDMLNGLAGNDILVADAGADTMDGGAGFDTYDVANSPVNTVAVNVDLGAGTSGTDVLSNVENVLGGAGNDTIAGTAGDNLLSGGAGNDVLTGLAGEDVLLGGLGNDTHFGGEGDDIFIANEGVNVYQGGAGDDALIINSSTVQNIAFSIDLGAGTDTFGNTYAGIENIDGGTGDDQLFGDAEANVLIGRAGDDTLVGNLGGDVLEGGEGDDSHAGGSGDDLLIANVGNDTFDGGAGIDTYDIDASVDFETDYAVDLSAGTDNLGNSYSGIENINGGWGDDTLTGTADSNILDGGVGDDVVSGGAGDDSLAGGLGNDMLSGGAGNDVLFGSFGTDTYDGGDGVDLIDIGGSAAGEADYNIDLTIGQDQFGNSYSNIENVNTGAGDDNIFGNAADNQLQGNEGDDTINGGAGNDFHNGGNGDDVFIANAGSNSYFGGNGIDTLQIEGTTEDSVSYAIDLQEGIDDQGNTSFGVENINAGSGDDALTGSTADNVLSGGLGDDTLIGGGGADTLIGGDGTDIFAASTAAGSVNIADFTQGTDQIDLSAITDVADFDDLATFLMTGGGSSTLTFDLDGTDQLSLIIQGEEELEEADFIFGSLDVL